MPPAFLQLGQFSPKDWSINALFNNNNANFKKKTGLAKASYSFKQSKEMCVWLRGQYKEDECHAK